MANEKSVLTLIPAYDEPATAGREIVLDGRGPPGGVSALARAGALSGRGIGGIFAGAVPDLVSLLAAPALAAAGSAAVGWLQGRAGRKVRLKVGDTEVEARTVAELKEMLTLAQTMKKNPKEEDR